MNLLTIIAEKQEYGTDIDYFIWYLMYCYEHDSKSEQTEKHHILPKSLFPEYKNLNINKWNATKLPYDAHFYAHYILAKAIPHRSIRFAFNQMRRVLPLTDKILGDAYSEFREQFRKDFGDINRGRKLTPEQKERLGKSKKGTVVVRHKDDLQEKPTNFMVDINHPQYLSGEFIPASVGRKHKDSTKQKMSQNGIKGTVAYHNPETGKLIYLDECTDPPKGFLKGAPESIKKQQKEMFTDRRFYHNPETKEQKRFKNIEDVPEGWEPGRVVFGENGNPFSGLLAYVNFKTGETGFVKKGEEYPKYCFNRAGKFAYYFKTFVSFNLKKISEVSGYSEATVKWAIEYPDTIINNKSRDKKAKENIGRPYSSLGIFRTPIKDFFQFSENDYDYI